MPLHEAISPSPGDGKASLKISSSLNYSSAFALSIVTETGILSQRNETANSSAQLICCRSSLRESFDVLMLLLSFSHQISLRAVGHIDSARKNRTTVDTMSVRA
uniref:AlNc14C449G11716 protein n=1 Tax=Albugo laibachii Nc14 TaxID=890382 RepID=F0WZX4_9STRA|nr:AlNc14C449G11716 [Albugo laibachii Nc14]|eukprot:CCA27054.1 AlNc14C449G11716 [Albugo laibachii Nc14]